MASTELILFAINTAVKLNGAARKHFIASTQARSITFPIPKMDPNPNITSALNFFKDAEMGRVYLDNAEFLKRAIKPHIDQSHAALRRALNEEERQRCIDYYRNYMALYLAREENSLALGSDVLSESELQSMLTISQWQDGDSPHPSLLMRIAGNLVDVAVDYFLQMPEAFNREGKNGKIIQAVLTGLDTIDFTDGIEPENIGDLPQRLLLVSLEGVSENASLFNTEPRFQELVSITTAALAKDIDAKIKAVRAAPGQSATETLAAKEKLIQWGEFVFKSVLASAGSAMIMQPQKFLKQSNQAHQDLTTTVAGALLQTILEDNEKGLIQAAFNEHTLEELMLASLQVFGRHPALVVSENTKHKEAIIGLVQSIATDLGEKAALFGEDTLAEIVRLVLENSRTHIELFWPDIANDPKKHKLINIAKDVVGHLAQVAVGNAKWTPQFTRDDLDELLGFVFTEVVDYPNWVMDKAGEINPNLSTALQAMIGSLRQSDQGFTSSADAIALLKVGLRAVIDDQDFVKEIQAGKYPIAEIFDLLSTDMGGLANGLEEKLKGQWQNLRIEAKERILSALLEAAAAKGLTLENINNLKTTFKSLIAENQTLNVDVLLDLLLQRVLNAENA
ncbi:hypothetical protein [Glaciecola petra]|uniref:Uncharacterized protein n=1 Tax=Glaciecola petra TaxID=3075602 RepID=A0ABU2ZS01_9ALTE|nr:hypothetical protein [Aestuariibacter sp. P117]MDT0595410.1 hypothetical protein [Aestuariibacter sp. P117]